jgi:hypothetical protein
LTVPPPSIVSSGCRDEACRDVGDVTPPFLLAALLAAAFESSPTDVVLIDAFLTRQVTELHGLRDAVDIQVRFRGPKEHLAAF